MVFITLNFIQTNTASSNQNLQVTSLVTLLDFMTLVVSGQHPTDTFYSNFQTILISSPIIRSCINQVPLDSLMLTLVDFAVTKRRISVLSFLALSPYRFKQLPTCCKAPFWGLFFVTFSLMTNVTLLTIVNF
jgi:hypothetical protein